MILGYIYDENYKNENKTGTGLTLSGNMIPISSIFAFYFDEQHLTINNKMWMTWTFETEREWGEEWH